MSEPALPVTAQLRTLALQFNLQPAAYADPFWWPPVLKRALGVEGCRSASGPTHALLSRWLLREHGLSSRLDFDFGPVAKRLWLLPSGLLHQLAFETGVLAQRDPIRSAIDGRRLQSLRDSLGAEAVELALAGPALPVAPPSATTSAIAVDADACRVLGAQLLLASADMVWHALLRRARLIFGALPPGWPALEERTRDRLVADIVRRADARFPSWRWLFC